jgi:uncharacterized protein YpmS
MKDKIKRIRKRSNKLKMRSVSVGTRKVMANYSLDMIDSLRDFKDFDYIMDLESKILSDLDSVSVEGVS